MKNEVKLYFFEKIKSFLLKKFWKRIFKKRKINYIYQRKILQ